MQKVETNKGMAAAKAATAIDIKTTEPVKDLKTDETVTSDESSTNCNEMFEIDSFMVVPKLARFFNFAGYGVLFALNTTFLKDIGLSAKEAGMIHGLRSIPVIFGCLFWTAVADKTKKHRLVVLILVVLAITILLPLPWIAQFATSEIKHESNRKHHKTGTKVLMNSTIQLPLRYINHKNESRTNETKLLSLQNTTSSNINGSMHVKDTPRHAEIDHKKPSHKDLYNIMLGLNLLAGFLYGPLNGFTDNIISMYVVLSPKKASLGQQIRFGWLGWGIAPALAGFMADSVSLGNVSPYAWVFIIYSICMCAYLLVVNILYSAYNGDGTENVCEKSPEDIKSKDFDNLKYCREPSTESSCRPDASRRLLKSLILLVMNPHVVFFFAVVLFLSAGWGIFGGFLMIFLGDLGSSSLNQGLAALLGRTSAFITVSFVDRIIKISGGEMRALAISSVILGVRALLISYLHNPWFALLYMPLTGLFLPVYTVSRFQLIMKLAPPELQTTLYGCYSSMYTTGVMLGNIIGGIVYDEYGGEFLFRGTAAVLFIGAMIIFLYSVIFNIRHIESVRANSYRRSNVVSIS